MKQTKKQKQQKKNQNIFEKYKTKWNRFFSGYPSL